MQEQLAGHHQVEHRVSDYEVPLALPGVSGSLSRIPPPAQVRELSRSQPLPQEPTASHDQDDYDSLSPVHSRRRPDSDDYDYVTVDKLKSYHDVKEKAPFQPLVLMSFRSVPCLQASLEHELHETNSLPLSPVAMTPLERAIADLELESRKSDKLYTSEAADEVVSSDFETSV